MRKMTVALLMTLLALPAVAAISKELDEWGKGPAQHLMTRDEQRDWKSARTDAEAQKFVDLFWARRDPTPQTPRNELKEQFEAAVKTADERFKEGSLRGAMTDRGKTLLLLGAPTRVARRTETTGAPSSTGDAATGGISGEPANAVTEIWHYEGARVPEFINSPKFELHFRDDTGQGRFRQARATGINLGDTWQKAQQQLLVSPDLTAVPQYGQPAPRQIAEVSIPAPAVTAPVMTSFKTQTLQTAVAEFKDAKASPYKDVYVTYGEFVTPSGDYFVPVQIYLSKNPGASTDKPVTFFGVVEDEQGQIVQVYEEPLPLQANKTEFFADKSVTLPPGKYKGTFGIAAEGKPLAIASTSMDLAALEKDAAGISRLILSNNIYALTTAQSATDPFAFGGIKVVPKGDRSFSKQDELWYFFELRNPGVDEATGKPKVQVKIDVEAKAGPKMGAPLQEAPAEGLKGVPGHFGVGSSIPLAGFAPGDYTIKLKVIDTIKKQTYNLEEKFKVVG